jgi:hypothetical protein
VLVDLDGAAVLALFASVDWVGAVLAGDGAAEWCALDGVGAARHGVGVRVGDWGYPSGLAWASV